jgi:hypothetical protein
MAVLNMLLIAEVMVSAMKSGRACRDLDLGGVLTPQYSLPDSNRQ